ncbi:MAG: heparin lyase I family protein [Candidatus Thiodiazotropha sp. L084R]
MKIICILAFFLFVGNASAYQAYIDNENAYGSTIYGNYFWIDDSINDEKYLVSHTDGAYLPFRYSSLSRNGQSSVKIQIPSSRNGIPNSSFPYNRSEIQLPGLPLEQEHWVKFSVYFQSEFPDPDDWLCFFQVWQEYAGTPPIGLYLNENSELRVNIRNDATLTGPALNLYTDTNQIRKGEWIDFVMSFRGSLDTEGYLKVWRKPASSACYESIVDRSQISIGKSVLPNDEVAQELVIYPKFGLYRAGSNLNHQVWFDEIKYNETGPLFYSTPPLCQ